MIKATDLKIEYLTDNPTRDIVSPKLLWKVQEAKTQTAYQVKASVDGKEIYDTGKVRSSVMDHKYQGKLKSRSQVTWKSVYGMKRISVENGAKKAALK